MRITIEPGIELAPLELAHSRALFDLVSANKNYLSPWLPWVNHMQDVSFIENYFSSYQSLNEKGLAHAFVILENEKIVGRIGIYKIDLQNKIGEIGYWIGQEWQTQGIVTKSCKKLLEYAFHTLQLNRIEIKCGTENYKSMRIPQLLNFTCEGTLHEAELIGERFIDLKLFSFLKSQWASSHLE